MFSVSPEIYSVLSLAARWLFAFFALMLLLFAFSWHHAERKEQRDRFKNLPGAGTVGELVVLSGSDELRQDTWFPVPREGVLGSLRTCDLVVPCPGVRAQHLDFSWQDGVGLLIRPRPGCDTLIDGVPVERRGAASDAPLLHGSVLQVGSAVLRLQLFSALSHTNRAFAPAAPVQESLRPFPAPVPGQVPSPGPVPMPGQMPVPGPAPAPYACPAAVPEQYAAPVEDRPVFPPEAGQPVPSDLSSLPGQEAARPAAAPRRKRADRWKEDWSE